MIQPFERECICEETDPDSIEAGTVAANGHTTACNTKQRIDFFAFIYSARDTLSRANH